MTVLVWIALGILAGWITTIITATPPEGRLANLIVGVIGAIVGGIILEVFGPDVPPGFDPASLLTAVLGAALLLGLIRRMHQPAV